MSNYQISVMDTKSDQFEVIETDGNTFGAIKEQLIAAGFEVDFKKRSYVIAESATELIGDDSQLGCCEGTTELTLCIYPKDTKAGLSTSEINGMGFAELRKEVKRLRDNGPKKNYEAHLAGLGGNPSTPNLKRALIEYYKKSGSSPATATATGSVEQRLTALEQRVTELENGTPLQSQQKQPATAVAEVDPKVAMMAKAKARAEELKRNASKNI